MENRGILLNRMYHLLERMDELAVAGDLKNTRTLNKYFSEFHVELYPLDSTLEEEDLGLNLDRARNNYLMSHQKGIEDLHDEILEDARKYLSKVEEQLAVEGIKVRKTLRVSEDKQE